MKPLPSASRLAGALLPIAAIAALLSVAASSLRPSNLLCVKNAAFLNIAVSQYVQDYDEKFPPTSTIPAFQAAVLPYAKARSVFTCPVTGTDYKPNPGLSNAVLVRLGPDLAAVEVFRDGQVHADGLPTIAYADGHIERGGIDQADPEQASLSNARQLALAVQQYTQDYDEILPPLHTPAEMQTALLPYVIRTRVFRSPVTGLLYTPNPSLSGKHLAAIADPASTELLRDPRRHRDGKSVIAYLDGHVVKR